MDMGEGRKIMAYTKPVVLAQNSKQGPFAAACPEKTSYGICKHCEVSA
jgi:hypothetical protein